MSRPESTPTYDALYLEHLAAELDRERLEEWWSE